MVWVGLEFKLLGSRIQETRQGLEYASAIEFRV